MKNDIIPWELGLKGVCIIIHMELALTAMRKLRAMRKGRDNKDEAG